MTTGLEGGEGSASRPGRSLPPGKDPVPIVQEAGWAPGPVWTGAKNLVSTWIYVNIMCVTLQCIIFNLFSTYTLQPSRLIVRSALDVPTFATRRLHACHHARAPSGGRWNCGRETSENFA